MLRRTLISVCVGATQRISLPVLARNPHKRPERETGSGGRTEGPKEDRESQLTKESRREQSAWDSGQEKDPVCRGRQWEGGSRAEKTVKRWVSISSGCVKVSSKYSPVIASKCTASCIKVSLGLPPSCAWSQLKPKFVRLFFSFAVSVGFCVSVKKCVMLLVGDEKKPTRWITGHE